MYESIKVFPLQLNLEMQ